MRPEFMYSIPLNQNHCSDITYLQVVNFLNFVWKICLFIINEVNKLCENQQLWNIWRWWFITLDETGTIFKCLQHGLDIYCCCTSCHDTKGWSNDIL